MELFALVILAVLLSNILRASGVNINRLAYTIMTGLSHLVIPNYNHNDDRSLFIRDTRAPLVLISGFITLYLITTRGREIWEDRIWAVLKPHVRRCTHRLIQNCTSLVMESAQDRIFTHNLILNLARDPRNMGFVQRIIVDMARDPRNRVFLNNLTRTLFDTDPPIFDPESLGLMAARTFANMTPEHINQLMARVNFRPYAHRPHPPQEEEEAKVQGVLREDKNWPVVQPQRHHAVVTSSLLTQPPPRRSWMCSPQATSPPLSRIRLRTLPCIDGEGIVHPPHSLSLESIATFIQRNMQHTSPEQLLEFMRTMPNETMVALVRDTFNAFTSQGLYELLRDSLGRLNNDQFTRLFITQIGRLPPIHKTALIRVILSEIPPYAIRAISLHFLTSLQQEDLSKLFGSVVGAKLKRLFRKKGKSKHKTIQEFFDEDDFNSDGDPGGSGDGSAAVGE